MSACTQWSLHITTDENSTLKNKTHDLFKRSNIYFAFPIFKTSQPLHLSALWQLEFLASKKNLEHEKFNSHLAFFAS